MSKYKTAEVPDWLRNFISTEYETKSDREQSSQFDEEEEDADIFRDIILDEDRTYVKNRRSTRKTPHKEKPQIAATKQKEKVKNTVVFMESKPDEYLDFMSGKNIETSDEEQEMLRQLNNKDCLEKPDMAKVYKRIIEDSAKGDSYGVIDCPLCKFASLRSIETESKVAKTYEACYMLDIEKYGYLADATLFPEIALLFNEMQYTVKQGGSPPSFMSVKQVADHFIKHDKNNPLRTFGKHAEYIDNALIKARDLLFTELDGREVLNVSGLKSFEALSKIHKEIWQTYFSIRASINIKSVPVQMCKRSKMQKGNNSNHMIGFEPLRKFSAPYAKMYRS